MTPQAITPRGSVIRAIAPVGSALQRGAGEPANQTEEVTSPCCYQLADLLFLDVKAAIEKSRLLGRGLTLTYLKPRGKTHFQFDAAAVSAALKAGGHAQVSS